LSAYHEHADIVQALLDRGAETARINDRGQTALVAAAFRGSVPIVEALLAAGADPDLGEPAAVEVARFFGHPDIAAVLTRQ
jgi:ankyrin repeat protein